MDYLFFNQPPLSEYDLVLAGEFTNRQAAESIEPFTEELIDYMAT